MKSSTGTASPALLIKLNKPAPIFNAARRRPRGWWLEQYRRTTAFRLIMEEHIHSALWPMMRRRKIVFWRYINTTNVLELIYEDAQWTRAREGEFKAKNPIEDRGELYIAYATTFPFEEPRTGDTEVILRELKNAYEGQAIQTTYGLTGMEVGFILRDPAILQAIEARRNLITVGTAKTQWTNIKRSLRDDFYGQGLGVREVRRKFQTYFDDAYTASDGQAMVIARTETRWVTGQANFDTMQANGVEAADWYAAGPRPCAICLACERDSPQRLGDGFGPRGWKSEADSHPGCFCLLLPRYMEKPMSAG